MVSHIHPNFAYKKLWLLGDCVCVCQFIYFFVRANARKESSSRRLQAFCAGGCAILHLVGSSYCKPRCNLALSAQAVLSQGHLNACEKNFLKLSCFVFLYLSKVRWKSCVRNCKSTGRRR